MYGFKLVDIDPQDIPKAIAPNHKSALQYKHKVENRLKEEIEDGNYIKANIN